MSNKDIKTITYNKFKEWLISFTSDSYLVNREFTCLQLFNPLERVVKVTISLKTSFIPAKDSVKDFLFTLKVKTKSPPLLIRIRELYLITLMIERKVDTLIRSFK